MGDRGSKMGDRGFKMDDRGLKMDDRGSKMSSTGCAVSRYIRGFVLYFTCIRVLEVKPANGDHGPGSWV
jgi:hypothetical protein